MTAENLQNLFLHEKTLENYSDHSILELILSTAGIQDKIPIIIDNLMDTFGSLKGILEAQPDQLMNIPDLTRQAATMISMVTPLIRIWERCNMKNQGMLNDNSEGAAYCKSLLMGERSEQFWIIALNSHCCIQGARKIAEGTVNEVYAHPRKVVEAALYYNAASVILCHNHPGGDSTPSQEDIQSTLSLRKILDSLGIYLLDHFIVAGTNVRSMVEHGDLEPKNQLPEQKPKKSKKKTKKGKKKK